MCVCVCVCACIDSYPDRDSVSDSDVCMHHLSRLFLCSSNCITFPAFPDSDSDSHPDPDPDSDSDLAFVSVRMCVCVRA